METKRQDAQDSSRDYGKTLLRVLVIGRHLPASGSSAGLFELEQAKALKECGADVVFCFADNRSLRNNHSLRGVDGVIDGVRCIGRRVPVSTRIPPLNDTARLRSLKSILSQLADEDWVPDVVYAHFPLMTLTVKVIDLLDVLGIPIVCMEHWTKVQIKELSGRQVRLLRHAVAVSSAYCCVSEDLRDSVCELTETIPSDIPVIPNMIDESLFYPKAKGDTTIARNAGEVVFVCCGRLAPVKRVDLVIRAFTSLREKMEARLIVVGDGAERRRLVELAGNLGVFDRVAFVGWLAPREVADILREADCYVSASSCETFCVPFAESWMCGTPCIGPNNNPLRREFSDDNGALFISGNQSSLAKVMYEVSEKVFKNGYEPMLISQKAKASYSSKAVTEKLLNDVLFEVSNARQAQVQ